MNSDPTAMPRRTAIGAIAAMGAGTAAAFGMTSGNNITNAARSIFTPASMGWDADKGVYTLPPLPYAPDALAPHIDAQTMTIHHDKHHAGYVRGLNEAISKLKEIREGTGDAALTQHWERKLSFNGGGHVNHTLFWTGMAPEGRGGGGEPQGTLRAAIDRDFGGFGAFTKQFKAAASSVEGSGWGWLVYEPIAGRLMVLQMENQQKFLFGGVVPILGVDVWEHAYYLNYQNRRGDYIDAFMKVANWAEAGRRFDAATGG